MIRSCKRLKLSSRSVSGGVGVCIDIRGTLNLELSPNSEHTNALGLIELMIELFFDDSNKVHSGR